MRFEKRTVGFLVTLSIVASVWATAMAVLSKINHPSAGAFQGENSAEPVR